MGIRRRRRKRRRQACDQCVGQIKQFDHRGNVIFQRVLRTAFSNIIKCYQDFVRSVLKFLLESGKIFVFVAPLDNSFS